MLETTATPCLAQFPSWPSGEVLPSSESSPPEAVEEPGVEQDSDAAEISGAEEGSFAWGEVQEPASEGEVYQVEQVSPVASVAEAPSTASPLWMNYFSILYGPSVKNPSSFQPSPDGLPDRERPILIKNHLSLGYDFNDRLMLAATLPFNWIPVQGHQFETLDPFLRLGLDHVLQNDFLNYYIDVRVHFPVTQASRHRDMLASIQTFQVVTLTPTTTSKISLDLFGSARANYYGKQGSGADLELYLAPELNYQMLPTLAFTLLYEMGASHWFGDRAWQFRNDGTDLEPGISWDVTSRLNFHPYINIYPTGNVSWHSTSVGMMLNWKLL